MNKLFNLALLFLLSVLFANTSHAQHEDITGLWKTIDDETGKPKSVVNIYIEDGKLFGDVVKLFRKEGEDPDPICDKCDEDDPRYNQKILGMTIINDMVKLWTLKREKHTIVNFGLKMESFKFADMFCFFIEPRNG